jgi:hypothetical protein
VEGRTRQKCFSATPFSRRFGQNYAEAVRKSGALKKKGGRFFPALDADSFI